MDKSLIVKHFIDVLDKSREPNRHPWDTYQGRRFLAAEKQTRVRRNRLVAVTLAVVGVAISLIFYP